MSLARVPFPSPRGSAPQGEGVVLESHGTPEGDGILVRAQCFQRDRCAIGPDTPEQQVQGGAPESFTPPAPADAALIACYHPFGQFTRDPGGREYRGVRFRRL